MPRGYLELRVAEHHEGGAGADTVALHKGHVQASDPPQAREGGVPLPRLRVPVYDTRLQQGLLPEGTHTSRRARQRPAHVQPGGRGSPRDPSLPRPNLPPLLPETRDAAPETRAADPAPRPLPQAL